MKSLLPMLAVSLAALVPSAGAQIADLPYGAPIPLAAAKRVIAAAQVEAAKNNWAVVIAVVDPGARLVALERMDHAQWGSVEIAQEKAYTAVGFKRPSKAFQDVVAAGGDGLGALKLAGIFPAEGSLPLVIDGKIVGAIGVSGATSPQDGQVAAAGVAGLK